MLYAVLHFSDVYLLRVYCVMFGVGLGVVLAALQGAPCTKVWLFARGVIAELWFTLVIWSVIASFA